MRLSARGWWRGAWALVPLVVTLIIIKVTTGGPNWIALLLTIVATALVLVVILRIRDSAIASRKPQESTFTGIAFLLLDEVEPSESLRTWLEHLHALSWWTRSLRANQIVGFVDVLPTEIRWRPGSRMERKHNLLPISIPRPAIAQVEIEPFFPGLESLVAKSILAISLKDGGRLKFVVRTPRQLQAVLDPAIKRADA